MPDPSPDLASRPDSLVIRAARVADFEGIATISRHAWIPPRHTAAALRSPDETRNFLEGVGPDDLSLVAERDGVVLGHAGWRRFKGRRAHVAEIGMGVHDDHVGRGIGTALLAVLVDAADRWYAVRRLTLRVYTDNARAIGLYRRFGFEEEGVARGDAFRDGRYADTLHMARIRPSG